MRSEIESCGVSCTWTSSTMDSLLRRQLHLFREMSCDLFHGAEPLLWNWLHDASGVIDAHMNSVLRYQSGQLRDFLRVFWHQEVHSLLHVAYLRQILWSELRDFDVVDELLKFAVGASSGSPPRFPPQFVALARPQTVQRRDSGPVPAELTPQLRYPAGQERRWFLSQCCPEFAPAGPPESISFRVCGAGMSAICSTVSKDLLLRSHLDHLCGLFLNLRHRVRDLFYDVSRDPLLRNRLDFLVGLRAGVLPTSSGRAHKRACGHKAPVTLLHEHA